MSVSIPMHVFLDVHVFVVTCLSPPHLLQPHNPPPYPRATAPHLTPPCPAPQGLSQKRDEKGNRFPPLWGAVTVDPSAQLRALSSGQWCPAGPLQPPQRTEAFEMSPQTPDSRDVALSGGCRGALMTDSIFVFVNMPRQRR